MVLQTILLTALATPENVFHDSIPLIFGATIKLLLFEQS